jgi:hydroxymethylglutaryl-CoA lyase
MALELPEHATLVEMLPRDGFQRLDEFVPTAEKVAIVDALSTTGVDEIEVTSFTHPEAVPTLRDAEEVAERITRRDGVTYRALVPNAVGMERALAAGMDKVNALVTVSETYSEHNQGMSVSETLAEVAEIVRMAEGTDTTVEAGIGTSFYCPYEGEIPLADTLAVVESVVEAGVDEVTLATTMGLANPREITEAFEAVAERHPGLDVGLHLHDTNGMSLANSLAAMDAGVDRFDASHCGLGGGVVLPEGMAGVGNTPTEDLLQMLDGLGVDTGAEFERVEAVARDVADRLELGATSHVLMGGTVEGVLAEMGKGSGGS